MSVKSKTCKKSILPVGLSLVIYAFLLTSDQTSIADQTQTAADAGPVIVSNASLTNREQESAGRQYTYQFRGKSKLLNPYVLTAGEPAADVEVAAKPLTEAEKLYRYFGVATSLYEQGKFEEAIEILEFIVARDPENEYVKRYLQKVVYASKSQEGGYKKDAKIDAISLKKREIKLSLKEGIDYYKQKQYDMAVVKFSDVLQADPGNAQAKHYMAKLKERYSKEARIERMVSAQKEGFNPSGDARGLAAEFSPKGPEGLKAAAQEIMDRGESLLDGGRVQDIKDIDSLAFAEKNNALLEQAELGLTIDEIIAKQKEEAHKSRMMTIGVGDVIQILVYDHEELSGQATVRSSGEAMLPLVGVPIQVKGLTIEEATEKIREEMKKYVKDPVVTVDLISSSKLFYFIDEVGCTPYPITRPNFTLRDALLLSDWGSNRALGRVIVIKPDRLHPVVKKVDAFDLIYRGNLANNVVIGDGDVVYVPMTVVGKTTQTLSDTIAPFNEVAQARDRWLDLKWSSRGWLSAPRVYGQVKDMPAEAQAASNN